MHEVQSGAVLCTTVSTEIIHNHLKGKISVTRWWTQEMLLTPSAVTTTSEAIEIIQVVALSVVEVVFGVVVVIFFFDIVV